jgi:peroxiredoxin
MLRKLSRLFGMGEPMTQINAGATAPDFSVKGLDGKTYSLAELLQKGPVVAAFFKISCPICQFTFPFIERLYQRYGKTATFLGISQDDAKSTTSFAREYGATFLMTMDEKEKGYIASNAYGLTMVPTIFLIDPGKSVRVSSMGFVKADLERIAQELAECGRQQQVPLFTASDSVPSSRPG